MAMRFLRHGLPALICVAGIVLLAAKPDETGLEGFVFLLGAGLSVWLLNWLFRYGARGDDEREREDAARAYFDRHGRWPDEE